MEKARLTQERADAKTRADNMGSGATVISAQNAAADVNESLGKAEVKKKKNAPEFFTAQVPGEKVAKVKKVKKAADKPSNASKAKKAATQPKDAAGKS